MLRLKNIIKNYNVAGSEIEVLKNINLSFRKNEFVSILGPSGCGKTTTLNIIGGLDKYTSGDLYIAGKGTKEFKDRDWDAYRNQRVGFVFQSYNLIPHQTVLGNVELALTISGISKEERQERAMNALKKVGIEGEAHKKPNQLSGGQCQRVAIARALVNEPEILLADEPTGALDTKTSIQIMELIKEIAQDRLVIMVTHNPDLAEQYSNRIIKLLDGEVVSDSNPFSERDEINEVSLLVPCEKEKNCKAKMSWFTAFKLSLRNLLSKKKRTIMTCIAGSIGIIGISAVLAVSSGVKGYVADMQDDMLSGNPITVAETGMDLSALMSSLSNEEKLEIIQEDGFVNVDSLIEYLVERFSAMENGMISNNITQNYIDYLQAMPKEYYASIQLDYGLDMKNNIYTDFTSNGKTQNLSLTAIRNLYTSVLKKTDFAEYSSLVGTLDDILAQAPNDEEYILSQYDVKSGRIAKAKNEIMIVLDSKSSLTDVVLANLGYYTQEEFLNIAFKATKDPNYTNSLDKEKFKYDELLGRKFTWYNNDSVFYENPNNPFNPYGYNASSNNLSNGLELEVVGIIMPKEEISFGCLSGGFYYTEELVKYALEENKESKILNAFNGLEDGIINSTMYNGIPTGICYQFTYEYNGGSFLETGFVGNMNSMASLMGSQTSGVGDVYQLSLRNVGGVDIASEISIYPKNFEQKNFVLDYLDRWNSDDTITVNGVDLVAGDREEIKYTDTLSVIISMINSMIDIITIALVAFTALSLVVSCVMIAIITYVSVVERVKEIGVIRSLGGRKRDVSNLFNAETLIIGTVSGVFGIAVTYIISWIANLVVYNLSGISKIAALSFPTALIMILMSILLTVLSGLIPASKAAHQDPVVALRSE